MREGNVVIDMIAIPDVRSIFLSRLVSGVDEPDPKLEEIASSLLEEVSLVWRE